MIGEISKEHIQEFKVLLEKKKGMEVSWEEASEGAYNLARIFDILFEHAVEMERWKKRLETSPKGFHLEGSYTCAICGESAADERSWYDKFGIKCLVCQRAVDKKVIPGMAARNKESWYSQFDLENRFNINRHAMNRFIKQGILKPRIVLSDNGKPHAYLFLLKDNDGVLPPKKLTESKSVKEIRDGKEWYHSEPWFRFADPHTILKGYKIMDYMRVVPPEEMAAREEAEKKKMEEKLARRLAKRAKK